MKPSFLTSSNVNSLINRTINWSAPAAEGNSTYMGTAIIKSVATDGRLVCETLSGDDLSRAIAQKDGGEICYSYSDHDRFITFCIVDDVFIVRSGWFGGDLEHVSSTPDKGYAYIGQVLKDNNCPVELTDSLFESVINSIYIADEDLTLVYDGGAWEPEKAIECWTSDKETGTLIDRFYSLSEAKEAIERYEEQDKKEGIFQEDYYEIVDNDHEPFYLGAYRGGARPGAGRKLNGQKKELFTLRLSPKTISTIKSLREKGMDVTDNISRYINLMQDYGEHADTKRKPIRTKILRVENVDFEGDIQVTIYNGPLAGVDEGLTIRPCLIKEWTYVDKNNYSHEFKIAEGQTIEFDEISNRRLINVRFVADKQKD